MTTPESRITVVGLGPGSATLLTVATREILLSAETVILRTRHHPTVAELRPLSDRWADCDELYQQYAAFDEVYGTVVSRVLAAAESGPVVFAVPGHPLVAERSVTLLLESAGARGEAVRVLPAVSFADVAATALGFDFANVQLCDAMDLRIDAQRPALISQLFDRDVTSALKLRLLEVYPAEHRVTVLSSLGTGGETTLELPLADLDHRPFGFLDALFVPAIVPLDDVRRFDGLAYVIARLHAPDGCPWDREQTHVSLRPHLLEESYEALEAIDSGDTADLIEELGDVLLQVLMHAAVGEREGTFSFGDVTSHIARKLIRRHPHVFGDVTADTADEVYKNWEALKQAEKPTASVLEGVPKTLPSLAVSQAIQGRARRIGFDWPDIEGPLDKLVEEVQEFARAVGAPEKEDEFGDILFVVANIGQRLGIDAEQALRLANTKFRARFGIMERIANERGTTLSELSNEAQDTLWNVAKDELRGADS